MTDPSIPESTKSSDPAAAKPISQASSKSTGAQTVIATLRYRPKPGAQVVEAEIRAMPLAFWRAAREWDSRMRNRNRWIADEELRAEVANLSRKSLNSWNVNESTIIALARSEIVEVLERSPLAGKGAGKPAKTKGAAPLGGMFSMITDVLTSFVWILALKGQLRRMPWESLLVMAARKYQNHERLLVYRRIVPSGNRKYQSDPEKLTALFVETAPGMLWNVYDFDFELKAVKTYLKGVPVERLRNPTITELTDYIKSNSPAIVHVSGVEGYQGLSLLKEQDAGQLSNEPAAEATVGANAETAAKQASRPQDGIYFRDESGQPRVETPEAVGAALCAAEKKPLLVTFNLYNSSARLASETVTRGAAAAIGFQDYIDDTVADIFFANMFRAWSEKPGTALLKAFEDSVTELAPYLDRVRGSGVTLWTSEPLLDDRNAICLPVPPKGASEGKGTGGPAVELEFDVETYPALNYSVLHNGKSKMFETFRIYKFDKGERTDTNVRVEIILNVGGHNFPFRQSYTMRHHILDLTDTIAVGLTSALSRSLRESVRTTIFVRITIGPDDERFCKTFDVSLLAVDEWIDDQPSGVFLPSFVLPRDPIIPEIIAKAQGYLMAIADDAAQGFDGYQSCDPNDDPAVSLEPQSRAIWYALQHDFAIKYINPPPTFTESSQRLRTPSETLKGGRGTCIDLALLLAACFEHIGLYPVVFLLSGHAFAGYWADEERRKQFRTTKYDPMSEGGEDKVRSLLERNPEEIEVESVLAPVEWRFDSRRRAEIQKAVQDGELVAIEATYLTNGGSFASACDVGETNLDEDEGFESMLDISLARDKGVTPLPLAVEEGR